MQWSFPSTKNGQIKGVADAGIETFQGDGIKALTRETCQNSLDAVVDDNKTVHVQFKQYYKKTNTIPGYMKYKSMWWCYKDRRFCRKFWHWEKCTICMYGV